MRKNDYIIRREQKHEYHEVETLVREAFWNVYRPGCLEHYVLHQLRTDPAFIPELSFVMEKDGRLIGQNVFAQAAIHADDGGVIPVLTMGPICILPELQHTGLGRKLLNHSLKKAAACGYGAVCLEGNIGFYGGSGFVHASDYGIRYHGIPDGGDASFFLAKELIPGFLKDVSGIYHTPKVYFVDEAAADAYDRSFPPKTKRSLPGQIF